MHDRLARYVDCKKLCWHIICTVLNLHNARKWTTFKFYKKFTAKFFVVIIFRRILSSSLLLLLLLFVWLSHVVFIYILFQDASFLSSRIESHRVASNRVEQQQNDSITFRRKCLVFGVGEMIGLDLVWVLVLVEWICRLLFKPYSSGANKN